MQAVIGTASQVTRELDLAHQIACAIRRRREPLISSDTTVQQVNGLVKQFGQMQKVMKQLGKGRMPDLRAMMRNAGR